MKKTLVTLPLLILSYFGYAQSQIITTGDNVVNVSNPLAADIVIGSNGDGGTRHDGNMMWWSNASADRISLTGDVFYLSSWATTTPNIALGAAVGGTSYFMGNVGMGITTPVNALTVVGYNTSNPGNTATFSSNQGPANTIGNQVNITSSTSAWGLLLGSDGSGAPTGAYHAPNAAYLINVQAGALCLGVNNTLNMMINSNGNVLVGKTTQVNTSYILDVAGSARMNQVTVNTTGADFVFAPKYKLMPLTDLGHFIKANHHLPGIEPAKDMQANGLNLGENQTSVMSN